MYRAAVHSLAGLILLVTLSYSIALADEINSVAVWDFGVRYMAMLVVVGPIVTASILLVGKKVRYGDIPSIGILLPNAVGLLLLSVLSFQTFSTPHGLWLEETIMDNHFCNCLLRYYLFPPYVGWIGLYLSVISYLSFRKLSRLFRTNGITVLVWLVGFVPVATFYGLILAHQWISKPYFIGLVQR